MQEQMNERDELWSKKMDATQEQVESAQHSQQLTQPAILPIAIGCPCVGCQRGSVSNCSACVAKQQAGA